MSDAGPLHSRRIVVTRPEAQSGPMVAGLQHLGAQVVPFPVVRIEPQKRVPGLDAALRNLSAYDWILFTSVNGVTIFWEHLQRCNLPAEAMQEINIAAIGPATGEALRRRGAEVAYIPEVFVGEALGEGLPKVAGSRIMLPRAAESRSVLPDILRRRGGRVDEFHLYKAIQVYPDAEALAALRGKLDALTFTSPSTVRHFMQVMNSADLDPTALPGSPVVACIGPITAQAAQSAGLNPGVVAATHTIPGLIQALVAYFDWRGDGR